MTETRKLRLIASAYCAQYKTDAEFFIEDEHPSGFRHLIVKYATGGYGGQPEFGAAIPDEWTEQEVSDLLLWPMKASDAPYPPWEVPSRAYGSPSLFRWWAGEEPE